MILTLSEAIHELIGSSDGDEDDDVSVPIMLVFSGANLLLDFVNVACFAKSGSSFGLQMVREEQEEIRASLRGLAAGETEALVASARAANGVLDNDGERGSTNYGSAALALSARHHSKTSVNLNMWSAWTVSVQFLTKILALFYWRGHFIISIFSCLFFHTACLCRYVAKHFRLDCGGHFHHLSFRPRCPQ